MRFLAGGLLVLCACDPDPSNSALASLPSLAPLDAAEVEAVLDAGVQLAPEVSANAVERLYDRAMLRGNNTCPGPIPNFWYEVCEADGVAFNGYSFDFSEGDEFGLYVAAEVVDGDRRFSLSGTATWVTDRPIQGEVIYSAIYGSFHDPGASDWTALGLSTDLVQEYRRIEDAVTLRLNGGFSGHAGPGTAVSFDDVGFWEGCPSEPDGVVEVRVASGRWATVHFDAVCDGCGEAFDGDGNSIGSVCVDMPEEVWSW